MENELSSAESGGKRREASKSWSNNVRHIGRRLTEPGTRAGTIVLLSASVLLVVILLGWLYAIQGLPSDVEIDRSRFDEASVVYSADGAELSRYHDENRTWVTISEISNNVLDALVAVEDHRFYSHEGIDIRRTIRSVFETLGGDVQGGSTITMQLARNAFPALGEDGRIVRKVREWVVASKLEGRYTKEEILEMCMNTVPFMYNAFGIEAAAQTYFQKPAADLELTEAATLIGMLRGTVLYNPVRNPDRSHERRNVVLQQMVEYGYLDQSTYESVHDEPTELDFRPVARQDDLAPYFAEYLRLWLDEWAQDNQFNLYTDGLRIHTTIDSRLQEVAEETVTRMGDAYQAVADVEWSAARIPHVSADPTSYLAVQDNVEPFAYFWETNPRLLDAFLQRTRRYQILQQRMEDPSAALDSLRSDEAFVDSVKTVYEHVGVGFVAIDPKTGEVKSWVGGRDFALTQYDNVAQSRRQPGSTFKPFVYAAAIESGMRSNYMVRDQEFEFVDPQTQRVWSPRNFSNISGRMMKLEDALAYSKNTITAQITMEVGPSRVADMARRMGIESPLTAVPSLGLGTSEVTLLEMAAAYGTIADLGEYEAPRFVTHIEDASGRVVARFHNSSERAVSEQTAYELIDMMRGVIEYGTGVRMQTRYGARGDFAGKTGTSQDGADAWFMFMSPELVVGSWVGFNTPSVTFRRSAWGQGSRTALPIVGEYFVRTSDQNVFSGQGWSPPPGYSPPQERDSLYFLAEDERFDSMIDSLRAVTDSLLAEGADLEGNPLDPDTIEFGDDIFAEEDDGQREGRDADDAEVGPEEPPLEELSETDRLNRLERTGGSIDDEGGEQEETEEEDRAGW